jgi:hypothetical protein
VTLASDSTGVLSVDDNGGSLTVDGVFFQTTQPISGTVTANLSATDNAVLDQLELNTDFGVVVGSGVEATALRVTLASDSTGVLSVDDNGGSLTVDGVFFQTTQPISGAVTSNFGTANELHSHNNAAPGGLSGSSTSDETSSVDVRYMGNVCAFGRIKAKAGITIEFMVSSDNSNFYKTGIIFYSTSTTAQEDFYLSFPNNSSRYVKLAFTESDGTPDAFTIVSSISGKQ